MMHSDPHQDNNPGKRLNDRTLLAVDAAAASRAVNMADTESSGHTPTEYVSSGDLHARRTHKRWLDAGRASDKNSPGDHSKCP